MPGDMESRRLDGSGIRQVVKLLEYQYPDSHIQVFAGAAPGSMKTIRQLLDGNLPQQIFPKNTRPGAVKHYPPPDIQMFPWIEQMARVMIAYR